MRARGLRQRSRKRHDIREVADMPEVQWQQNNVADVSRMTFWMTDNALRWIADSASHSSVCKSQFREHGHLQLLFHHRGPIAGHLAWHWAREGGCDAVVRSGRWAPAKLRPNNRRRQAFGGAKQGDPKLLAAAWRQGPHGPTTQGRTTSPAGRLHV